VGRDADPAAFSEELGGLLSGITFIVFGAAVLSTVWSQIGFAEVVYAVLSLTLVRMVPVTVAMLGSHARTPTVLFLGWFGPRGLASIVFGVVIIEAAGLPHVNTGSHDHGHRRAQRLRSRHQRRPTRSSLRVLACDHRFTDGECTGAPTTLALPLSPPLILKSQRTTRQCEATDPDGQSRAIC
jgi:hypothetical protein